MLKENQDNSIAVGNILKLVFIILILAITLFFGYYPLLCKLSKRSTRFLGFFNSFSGGVFMGIGLFLLLPQSKEVLEDWSKNNIEDEKLKGLPLCFFFSFMAYSFMLLVEKVVFSSQSLIPMVSGEGGGHAHVHDHDVHDHEHEREVDSHRESQISSHKEEKEDSDEDEEAFKNVVSAKGKFASFLGMRNSK